MPNIKDIKITPEMLTKVAVIFVSNALMFIILFFNVDLMFK